MRALVKALLALALIAVAGFALAGCGSSKKAVSRLIIVTGTTTVSNVKTGVFIGCKGGPAAKVPPRGEGLGGSASQVAVSSTTTGVPPVGEIQLTHLKNGSVTVSCRP